MQFSKVLSFLSLFAASLAVPTIESIRTRSDAPVCNNFVSSSLQCCSAPQTIGPADLLTNLPLVTSLLPIIATIPIGSLLDIPISLSCTPIIGATLSDCTQNPTCCITSQPQGVSSTGLISLLNNNQVNLCSPISL